MHEELLVGLTIIITLGIVAQWIAWRFRLPSILLLLLFGFLAGPVTNILHIDEMLGDLLFPIVSLSVAIILFEGGLTLRFKDLAGVGRVFYLLLTVGVLVTWVLTAVAANLLLGFDLQLSLLIGAILVVTGPTVIIPMLNQIRPIGRLGSILRWEGIVIDPIGATLTVLVFEQILFADQGISGFLQGLIFTILIGVVLGFVVAKIILMLLGRHWLPDYLENPVALLFVLGSFTLSNQLVPESGLLTVTLAGIFLANQDLKIKNKWSIGGGYRANVQPIQEFVEILQVVLVASLFILLSARLRLEDLAQLGVGTIVFIAVLILLIRPLAVFLSTVRSSLRWQERVFIAWMAPRGIVAASIASVFALELAIVGQPGAELLAPAVFSVIIGTVIVYGLTAGPLATRLGVAQANPQGTLIVGAHDWAREIALGIQNAGYKVTVVDTNWAHIQDANMAGLNSFYGSILTDEVSANLDLNGIGRVLALTANDDVNTLACIKFSKLFGRSNVYQLPTHDSNGDEHSPPNELHGRFLFASDATFEKMDEQFREGGQIKATPLTSEFDGEDYFAQYGSSATPLFIVERSGNLLIGTNENRLRLQPDNTVISLIENGTLPQQDA